MNVPLPPRSMTPEQRKRLSKRLALHLRHDPQTLGLTLEPGGWVPVQALLEGLSARGHAVTLSQLEEVVLTNDKGRFSFDDTGQRVRANQGHSTPVDLQLEQTVPPGVLYHGTGAHNRLPILEEGLRKIWRHHVHFSSDPETARRVGARHGTPLLFAVQALEMQRAGHLFFRSSNGVWLTEAVPPEFLAVWPG